MIEDNDNPRPDMPRPKWDTLEKLKQPALPVLAKFVHGCSKDPNERTIAVTLLVTSLCQLAGRRMMSRMPSTIVVNGRDLVPDPLDFLARHLVPHPSGPEPGICREGAFLGGTATDAPRMMARAIEKKSKLARVSPLNAGEHQGWVDRYFAAQRAGFGSGPSRGYAKAWHDVFELLTDRSDELILRIDSPQDRAALRKDVLERTRRLREPLGYGPELTLMPKHIGLSGSLAASAWDAPLASGLVELGLPLLALPSLATEAPEIANDAVLQFIADSLPASAGEPVEEPANLIPIPWFEAYGRELRTRLHHLPGNYEYSMQKLARQIFPACLHITSWCGGFSGSSGEEVMALTYDLCGHALRGLVLSVAGLAWHGLGFDAGCPHKEVVRILEYLRAREPMTKSELLRGAHLTKEVRDSLLESLEAEGLVRVAGKRVEATSYVEFVERLYSRNEFPQPVNHWAKVAAKEPSAA